MSGIFGNTSGGGFGSTNTTSAPPSTGLFGSGGNAFGQSSQPQSTGFGQSSQPQQSGSLFGSTPKPQQGGSVFGGFGQQSQAPQTGGLFAPQPQQGGSLFGQPAQPAQGGSSFGGTSQPTQGGGLFGQPAQPVQGGSLFGGTSQPQQGGSIFGQSAQPAQSGPLFGGTPQPQQGGIFGQSAQPAPLKPLFGGNTQPQQGGSIFGQSAQPAQSGPLFGGTTQPQQGGIFGQSAQPGQLKPLFGGTSQPQQGGIFGQPAQPAQAGPLFGSSQPQQAGSLFGAPGQGQASIFGNPQQQEQLLQQQQRQQLQTNADLIGPSRQNRIWLEQALVPDYKSVPEQIDLIFRKWNPDSADSVGFQTYLYNTVSPDAAPFFRPGPNDNEDQWEAALRKRPNPGAVPFMLRGFYQLGQRILIQEECLRVLHGRLYEINAGLTALLTKHDVDITTRTAQCRRKHQALSQKCLALATKTQLLRNRGYAMDGLEEDLRQKLLMLEKQVFDPALEGRGEEIWARMVSVRERGRSLQYEMEKRGLAGLNAKEQSLDEETLEKARKILADYHKQLEHLAKELEQLQTEWTEWESGNPKTNGTGTNANSGNSNNGAMSNGVASSQAGRSGLSSSQNRRVW
ncbi:hypothetical protein MMC17_000252 [Xylographa soralifera]|nr:hypothetical protein [Xylographa soralifera]